MSPNRWKVLCAVLGALTLYSWTREPVARHGGAATSAQLRAPGIRPLRVAAGALGVTSEEVVEQLLTSRSNVEMRNLAEQLGAIGDDAAIDAVLRLVADPRPGVPAIIIAAIGSIGTDHAIAVLIDLANDPRSEIVIESIYALGSSGNERAETFLVGRAKKHDPYAISALGQLATARAVDVLYRIGSSGADDAAQAAITALGSIDSSAAVAALSRLIDSPSLVTAARAIAALQNIDDAMLAKLTQIVKAGEAQLAHPAALAIAHVGADAVPVLTELAADAPNAEVRVAAVRALGTIHSEGVVPALGSLLDDSDSTVATEAARSLAQLDTPEARDLLISAALSDLAESTQAVESLVTMQGPDVDQALFEVAKTDSYGAERALTRLLSHEHPEALELVVARTATGTTDERIEALSLLADAGTETASQQLFAVVKDATGELKIRGLELVSKGRPGDPAVTTMLRGSLLSADIDEQRAAAVALGTIGTDEARDALVDALRSGNSDLTATALSALGSYRLDEAASNAIYAAAVAEPSLIDEAMRKLVSAGSPAGLRLAETALAGEAYAAGRTLDLLAGMNTPGAIELITRSVRSRDDYVRATAVRILAATRAERALEISVDALRDPSFRVRETAAGALRQLGGERAGEALINMTRSSDPVDRRMALEYLPETPAAMERLRSLVRDSDASVAYGAMRALAASGQGGAAQLRTLVFANSASLDTRLTAAHLLRSYDLLDDATRSWLDTNESYTYD